MRVAVIPNEKAAGVCMSFERVCEALADLGAEVVIPAHAEQFPSSATDDAIRDSDVTVALGGDGTIIHVAKRAARFGRAVLGVNGGRLGFMAGLESNELEQLSALIQGNYTVEQRLMLDIEVRDEQKTRTFHALNEAVISRGALSRLIELDVANHGEPVVNYQADGVIIATPTGSTAYSLSAGGPIVDPSVGCMVLTPICPHSLYARSYVFAPSAELNVKVVLPAETEAFLTLDGEEGIAISEQESIAVRASDVCARLIKIKLQSFYDLLSRKLINRR